MIIKYTPPKYIVRVMRRLADAGFCAFLVGGGVRDMVMNRHVRDWDLATSARAEQVVPLFPKTVLTGVRFGTVTVILPECSVEVTTFRTDGRYTDSRRPDSVTFITSLAEDLSRRDFTINAMAVSESGELTDLYGGCDDIRKRLIRCVGDPETRFREDALRMLRAHRFAAELGFSIDEETAAAIKKCALLAELLSAERVYAELEKALMSQNPECVSEMISTGLLSGRVKTASKVNLSGLAALPREAGLRWAGLCALLSQAGLIGQPADFLREMRLDARTVKCCSIGLNIAHRGFPMDNAGIKKLLAAHGSEAVRMAAASQDSLSAVGALAKTDAVITGGECFSLKQLAVSGKDLLTIGIPPGRGLGGVLEALLLHVIDNPEDNIKLTLLQIAINITRE